MIGIGSYVALPESRLVHGPMTVLDCVQQDGPLSPADCCDKMTADGVALRILRMVGSGFYGWWRYLVARYNQATAGDGERDFCNIGLLKIRRLGYTERRWA